MHKMKSANKKPKLKVPGVREFQILELLWNNAPLSVSEVQRKLKPTADLAYTTVMTILDQMFKKGLVSRVKKGKRYYYNPSFSKNAVLENLTKEFIKNYYGGDALFLIKFIHNVFELDQNTQLNKHSETPASTNKQKKKDITVVKNDFAWNDEEEDYLL